MKKITFLPMLFLGLTILFAGCKKEAIQENDNMINSAETEIPGTANSDAQKKLAIEKINALLPPNWKEKALSLSQQVHKTHPQQYDKTMNYLRRAIDGDQYECDNNTVLDEFISASISEIDHSELLIALNYFILNIPTYEALLFDNDGSDEYFGTEGQYTHRVTKSFKDLKRFWDIYSDDIILIDMHGTVLLDDEKTISVYMALFDMTREEAEELWTVLKMFVNLDSESWNYGNHPLLSLNAFAFTNYGMEIPPFGIIPDKVVMGDGIMEFTEKSGFEDVGVEAIMAHEFAHHIQFENGYFDSPLTGAEATRRTELMADAFASYYLNHARGAAMQWKRVQQFLAMYYSIGDCSFSNSGHHGTPQQRMRAAEWGYRVADEAQKQGHILSSQQLYEMFEEKFPEFIAPDVQTFKK